MAMVGFEPRSNLVIIAVECFLRHPHDVYQAGCVLCFYAQMHVWVQPSPNTIIYAGGVEAAETVTDLIHL